MIRVKHFLKVIFLICILLTVLFLPNRLNAEISRLDLYLDKQFNERNDNKITPIAFSLDNKLIAFVTPNKTIRLWNLKKGCRVHEFVGHSECINAIAFSSNGKLLASGSSDKTVRLWDVKNGDSIYIFSGYDSAVCTVAFNPNGLMLVTMSFDGTVMVFDVETKSRLHVFQWPL